MNEFFLISFTLVSVFIRGNDRLPSLMYCLVAHAFNFVSLITTNDAQIFMLGAVGDVLVIALLACLNGCLKSRITYFLIPLSLLSIVMHYFGWRLYIAEASLQNFNSLVVLYQCVILALLISRIGLHGDTIWHTRFLRRTNSGDKNVGVVSK